MFDQCFHDPTAAKRAELKAVEDRVAALKQQFKDMTDKKELLEKQVDLCAKKTGPGRETDRRARRREGTGRPILGGASSINGSLLRHGDAISELEVTWLER